MRAKSNINKCLKYAEKIRETKIMHKPVLGYSCNDQIKDKQVFCDSFFIAVLNEEDKLDIPDYKESKLNYPDITCFLDKKGKEFIEYKINVGKLKMAFESAKEDLKAKNYTVKKDDLTPITITNGERSITIGDKTVLLFIEFMNFKDNDNIILKQNSNKLFISGRSSEDYRYFVDKDNGSYGLVLGAIIGNDIKTIDIEELQ